MSSELLISLTVLGAMALAIAIFYAPNAVGALRRRSRAPDPLPSVRPIGYELDPEPPLLRPVDPNPQVLARLRRTEPLFPEGPPAEPIGGVLHVLPWPDGPEGQMEATHEDKWSLRPLLAVCVVTALGTLTVAWYVIRYVSRLIADVVNL